MSFNIIVNYTNGQQKKRWASCTQVATRIMEEELFKHEVTSVMMERDDMEGEKCMMQ